LEELIAQSEGEDTPAVRLSIQSLRRRLREVTDALASATRPRVAVRLSGPNVRRNEIAVSALAPFLQEFQETLSSIGQALEGSATSSSSIPKDIRDRTKLVLSSTGPGSFVFDLHAPSDPRVVEPP